MDVKALERQITRYTQWKETLSQHLASFEHWGQQFRMVDTQVTGHFERARQLLASNHFTIACVGEFSRGKTELINALLFGQNRRRILPSQPGRTTMCPTEIYADPKQLNCLRLLPIETRRTQASLHSFKRIPHKWVTLHFDPQNPDNLSQVLSQVSAHKRVPPEEAERLGFGREDLDCGSDGLVAVPTWRHALISLDHPLLRQGLRILDTPGLNALGNEPELTLKTLPDSQMILFLLAADAGVSASDMTIWREHIQGLRDARCTAVLALLNKIDSLWDDFLNDQDSQDHIESVRQHTARLLQLPQDQVLAISAKQALLARAGNRPGLLQRSNFPHLEQMLAECIYRRESQLVHHRLIANCRDLVATTQSSLARHLTHSEQELEQLHASSEQDAQETLNQQRAAIRTQHNTYHKRALSLRTSQHLLERQRTALLAPVSSALLEQHIADAQRRLSGSWTTLGLARAIGQFFESVDHALSHLEREVERANRVLRSIYERSEQAGEHQLSVRQQLLDIAERKRLLQQLQQRADHFRSSLDTVLTRKSTLISRFIATLVQEVRGQFRALNSDIETWLEQALEPLFQANQYQKQLLEHHMLNLTRLQRQQHSHSQQLVAQEIEVARLRAAHQALLPIAAQLAEPEPLPSAEILSLAEARALQAAT